MPDPIRVIVVDDHPLYRSGVVATLREYPDIDVVGQGASASDAVELVVKARPDIALLDISMPGGGLNAIGQIRNAFERTKIIMLTASEDEAEVMTALESGSAAYALKGVGGDDLASIIRSVANGGSYVEPTLAGRLLINARNNRDAPTSAISTLSARELDVARLLTAGMSNKEIARKLGLQEKTVKHHMTQVLQKLRVRNRVEAAMLARSHFEKAGRSGN